MQISPKSNVKSNSERVSQNGAISRITMAKVVVGLPAALFASSVMAAGWISLGIGFLTYKDAGPNDVLNLAVHGDEVLAAASEQGLKRMHRETGAAVLVAPPEGLESIDDVFVTDGFVFVLDARAPGAVAILDPANDWTLTGPAQPVEVGPFLACPCTGRDGCRAEQNLWPGLDTTLKASCLMSDHVLILAGSA